MRVEPEPMAAVFFDVEPEEEEEMATTVKVIKGIMNELLLPSLNQYPIRTDRCVYA